MKKRRKDRGVFILLAAMLSILVLFIATVLLSTHISRRQLARESYAQYESNASYLKTISNAICLSTNWISSSFLSSMMNLEQKRTNGPDSVKFRHFMTSEQIAGINTDNLYSRLDSFLAYNYEYSFACLIFAKGVLKDAPEGFAAAKFTSDSLRRHNLVQEWDIFSAEPYIKTATLSYPSFLTAVTPESEETQMMLCVPIFDSSDNLIAQFWTGSPLKKFFAYVESCQSDSDDYSFALFDREGRLIYAPGLDSLYGMSTPAVLSKLYKRYPDNFSELLDDAIKSGESSSFSSEYDNKKLMAYVFPIKGTDLSILKVYLESTILRSANKTIKAIEILSIISFILILLQLGYIFMKYYRQSLIRQKIDNELDIARQIQRGMLPVDGSLPMPSGIKVYGYQRSARMIGGDLYDYTVKNGKLYFCIGDVSGNGIPAALMMSQICSLLRHIVKTVDDAAGIVSTLNDSALDNDEDRMFCTLFAGVLDPESGEVKFCNAGHCRPVIMGKNGPGLLEMKANMPVYAFDSYPYTEEITHLQPGDTIFLYTDGITEARNSSGAFFGSDALLTALQGGEDASEVVNRVMEKVDGFSGSCEQHDDITMLCINFHGQSEPSEKTS